MTIPVKSPRKLIEVALPLDAINAACSREKAIRHGHPSTMHLWWARRPLAAARAVIFAQMVNDPGYQQGRGFKYGKNKKEAAIERKRLFQIIEDLVVWKNTTNEDVVERARAEIRRSWREVCELNKDHPEAEELFNPEKLPAFHDPFAGGGAIPLEAQRLGLEAYASDLNPVAVLINKCMIEIPQKFAGHSPVGPVPQMSNQQLSLRKTWVAATGMAEDVRRYGLWMFDEARQRVGNLYPLVEVTPKDGREQPALAELVGEKLTVIGWIWARTVKSPNPAFSHVDVPLASTFVLCTREGEEAYLEPVVNGERYSFRIKRGLPPTTAKNGTKLGRGSSFVCLLSGTAIEDKYIKSESMSGRMGARLMAIIAEGPRGRVYLPANDIHVEIASKANPKWKPDLAMSRETSNLVSGRGYGFFTWADLFTARQQLALSTFSDLVAEVRDRVKQDAVTAGYDDDGKRLSAGGIGATAYADAIATYLGLCLSKSSDYWSNICIWRSDPKNLGIGHVFARQAIPMTWDYAEGNPFSASSGSWPVTLDWIVRVLSFSQVAFPVGSVTQSDAASGNLSEGKIVSTDPPYYDNIAYADLSDFFYVWLRPTLKDVFPELFATVAVPKAEELVATPYRHGGQAGAESFFLDGMTRAMHRLAEQAHPAFPVTIYYAFKQSETDGAEGTCSTGWVTFLDAIISAGFSITGTWPMRTEMGNRTRGMDTNSLASSIILVCCKRPVDAATISRREFLRELNAVLPEALDEMTRGLDNDRSPVAPVDLSQSIIGPGMAVFSKYAAVLEADGAAMTVRTALQLINRFLAEDDFDRDTQFCLHWFEHHGWKEGPYGDADTLSRAKGTSVDGVRDAGVVESGGGRVRLRKWSEYPVDWDPATDKRNPVWETLHQLILALRHQGEGQAGRLLALVRNQAESVRQLAYRLYTLCERERWAEDARAYNELITSWSGIEVAANAVPERHATKQLSMFE